jgi:hypothetical protein
MTRQSKGKLRFDRRTLAALVLVTIGTAITFALVRDRTKTEPASATPAAPVPMVGALPDSTPVTSVPAEIASATGVQPQPGPLASAPAEHVQEPELLSIPRITADELRTRIDRGEVAVIDVRDIESYRASHIPGALHIPLSFIEGEIPYLPRDKALVAYCT